MSESSSHQRIAFRPELHQAHPYTVPSSQGMVKLDAMENPFSLPENLRNELAQRLANTAIHRYPDASLSQVKAGLHTLMSPPKGAECLVGNGSDEILQLLIMAAAKPGATVMGIEPSFVMYKLLCQWLGVHYHGVSLRPDFSLDMEQLCSSIQALQPNLIFLAYPNNPTGNCFPREEIEQLIRLAPGLVVIDEAYYAFTDHSFLPSLFDFPNVIVVRTVSKLGMAGLRLGCAFGKADWIRPLEGLRLPYNINCFTQAAFDTLVGHQTLFKHQTELIREERTRLYQALQKRPYIESVWPSECNFLLIKVTDAPFVHAALKSKNILIKQLHGAHPLLEHVLRVSIGSPAENNLFLDALDSILSSPSF
jgi:histidinol-phosphate aminotransferase